MWPSSAFTRSTALEMDDGSATVNVLRMKMFPCGALLLAPVVFQIQSAVGVPVYDGIGTLTPGRSVTLTGLIVAVFLIGGISCARSTPAGAVKAWTLVPHGPMPNGPCTVAAGHDESSNPIVFQPAGGDAGV